MKLKDFLKSQGHFSSDINARIKSGQIKVNGEQVKTNIDLPFGNDVAEDKLKDHLKDITSDLGDFIFWNICSNQNWVQSLKIFNIEDVMDSNIDNDLTKFLQKFIIIRTSKMQALVVERS